MNPSTREAIQIEIARAIADGMSVYSKKGKADHEITDALSVVIKKYAALIEAAIEQSRWRPISEAPKDGTEIDLWIVFKDNEHPGSFTEQRYTDCKWGGSDWSTGDFTLRDYVGSAEATHFMPLPLPPQVTEE